MGYWWKWYWRRPWIYHYNGRTSVTEMSGSSLPISSSSSSATVLLPISATVQWTITVNINSGQFLASSWFWSCWMTCRRLMPGQGSQWRKKKEQDNIYNKSSKETMIKLFQYARPQPQAKTLFSYRCQVIHVGTWINNIIFALHFLVMTNDHFMKMF